MESSAYHELYAKHGTHCALFDASARSLIIEKMAKTMADDGNEALDAAL
ncbi:MAG TPA: hypothetical protein VF690_07315 [Hymenobacter sp.]